MSPGVVAKKNSKNRTLKNKRKQKNYESCIVILQELPGVHFTPGEDQKGFTSSGKNFPFRTNVVTAEKTKVDENFGLREKLGEKLPIVKNFPTEIKKSHGK